MEESRSERVLRFAELHLNARLLAGKSQEYMAFELKVSKKTIQNWEKGISSPSFFQSLEWFRALNQNPFPYYMSYLYPAQLKDINSEDDAKIEASFDALIKNISIKDKRAFLFLYYGNHGSSPHSIIQLVLAHLHTPMHSRIANAFLVTNVYELYKRLNSIICPDQILPDMDDLENSIAKAQEAVKNSDGGYTTIDKTHLM